MPYQPLFPLFLVVQAVPLSLLTAHQLDNGLPMLSILLYDHNQKTEKNDD